MKRNVKYFVFEFVVALIFYLVVILGIINPEFSENCTTTKNGVVMEESGMVCKALFFIFTVGAGTLLLVIAILTLKGKIVPPK